MVMLYIYIYNIVIKIFASLFNGNLCIFFIVYVYIDTLIFYLEIPIYKS